MTDENRLRIKRAAYEALLGLVKAAQASAVIVEHYQAMYQDLLKTELGTKYDDDWISDMVWDTTANIEERLIKYFEVI